MAAGQKHFNLKTKFSNDIHLVYYQTNDKISHGKSIRIKRSDIRVDEPVVKNPKDPKYIELAMLSLDKYKSDVESNQDYFVAQVTRATEQRVAGLLTEIDFYALTICIIPDCPEWKCHSSIFEQSWLRKTDITVYCDQL